jgi:hypothetical protein
MQLNGVFVVNATLRGNRTQKKTDPLERTGLKANGEKT